MSIKHLGLALSLVAALLVGASQPVSADAEPSASGCPGDLVGSYPFAGGRAQVDVYFSSSTGRNCLKARTVGDYWGRATRIGIAAGVSPQPLPTPDRPTDDPNFCRVAPYAGAQRWAYRDCGTFKYYAGPISFPAQNRCIDFDAAISFRSDGAIQYWITRFRVHCG